ncbi:MAG: conjugal transfer protein TrbE [Fusobacterium necrophorum]|nr:conjugal transfer protein TrbE [Fusobacterium necrophorum]
MDHIIMLGLCMIVLFLFLKHEREYRYKDRDQMINYFPWGYLIGDGIIFNKNGSYQKTYLIRGKDINSLEDIDLLHMRTSLNDVFKRFNGSWAIHVEARRKKAKPYSPSQFSSLLLQKIDEIREKTFNSGNYFSSEYYLTFIWLPPVDMVGKLQDKLIQEGEEERIELRYIEEFESSLREHIALLKDSFYEMCELNDEETLTYIHSCFSQHEKQIVKPMRYGTFLDAYLSDTPVADGLPPKLGEEYLGIVSILSFPNGTFPAMFHEINDLGIEMRWTSRFIFLDKEDSIKKAQVQKSKWSSRRKSATRLAEQKATKKDLDDDNYEASTREIEADAALQGLQNEDFQMGYYTFSIVVKDKSIRELNKKLERIEEIIQGNGFISVRETVNILQAFLGSMPGNLEHNVRRVPIPTLTAMDLLQFLSVWSGNPYNEHFQAPALFSASAISSTSASHVNIHVGDVGHTSIYGKTGSGKSVLLGFIAAQFKKYQDSQVFFFDKGASSKVLTTAVGGKFYDLGKDDLSFQPLAKIGLPDNFDFVVEKEYQEERRKWTFEMIEEYEQIGMLEKKEKDCQEEIAKKYRMKANQEKNWAFEWLCDIFTSENVTLTPELKNRIIEALNSMSTLPVSERTITQLELTLQNHELRDAIHPYTNDGAFGQYFDGNEDFFNPEYSWQVFEMDTVMNSSVVSIPLLKYLFHKLEVEMFNGKYTILILDECWKMLDNPQFAEKLREWLKELRKKEVSVVFATQELTDVLNSPIKDTLLQSCPTTIYLSNPKANTKEYKSIYDSLGLNKQQIDMIASLKPKRDYYAVSELGNLDFHLTLSPLEIAFLGTANPKDHEYCSKLARELQDYPKQEFEKEFYKRWLQYKNIPIEE